MTTNDTCPHCGAEKQDPDYVRYYKCWTNIDYPSHRDEDCYKRQIEQQAAALDLLEALELLLGDSAVEGCDEYRKEKAYAAISKARGEVK